MRKRNKDSDDASDIQVYSCKPKMCPACKHSPVAPILYGMPMMDEKIQEGRLLIGGCEVEMDAPAWKCTNCGLEICRKDAPFDIECI